MPAKNLSQAQLSDMAINEIETRQFLSATNAPIIEYFNAHNDLESLTTALKMARKFQVKSNEWDLAAVNYHFKRRFDEINTEMRNKLRSF